MDRYADFLSEKEKKKIDMALSLAVYTSGEISPCAASSRSNKIL